MLCWIYRQAIAWAADTAQPPPAWIGRHVKRCPSCAGCHQEHATLSQALQREKAPPAEFPPFLHARIVAGLERASDNTSIWMVVARWTRAAAIPGLAVVIVGVYGMWRFESRRPEPFDVASTEPTPVLPARFDSDQVLAWSRKIDQPLEGEMKAMVSDARLALNSLGETFLPTQFIAQK